MNNGINKKMKMNKGNLLLSMMFFIFVTFAGISLLSFSVLHTRIVKARTHHITLSGRLVQDLTLYLHRLREQVFGLDLRDWPEPETGYFNRDQFPDQLSGSDLWVTHDFSHVDLPGGDPEYYRETRVAMSLKAASASGRHHYRVGSEVCIDILSGRIPLDLIPFFLNTAIGTDRGQFLGDQNIIGQSDRNVVVEEVGVDFSIAAFLTNSLKISGNIMGWRQIREKFGLPPSDDPIPEGFHLLVEDGVLESIFIQGDVERIIFFTAENHQVQGIRFIKETLPHELRYRPGEPHFTSWDLSVGGDLLFKQKIIVNGSAWSIEQEGDAAFVERADIRLLVSGKSVITSDLQSLDAGLRVSQITLSNLKLTCGQAAMLDGGGEGPEVVTESHENTRIDANIMVEGKLTNNTPGLVVNGSIYARELDNNGSITIHHVRGRTADPDDPRTIDFTHIAQFFINFIEEITQ